MLATIASGSSVRHCAAVAALVTVLSTAACSGGHLTPSVAPPIPTTIPEIAAACRNPDALVATNHPVQVGDPAAPTVGPLSFHPYPYQPDYPTKMIINAVRDLEQPVTIRGYRCTDGMVLRFAYGDSTTLPTAPYTTRQLQTELGSPVIEQSAITAGGDHGGYALFSSTGQWLLTVSDGPTLIGVLRVAVS